LLLHKSFWRTVAHPAAARLRASRLVRPLAAAAADAALSKAARVLVDLLRRHLARAAAARRAACARLHPLVAQAEWFGGGGGGGGGGGAGEGGGGIGGGGAPSSPSSSALRDGIRSDPLFLIARLREATAFGGGGGRRGCDAQARGFAIKGELRRAEARRGLVRLVERWVLPPPGVRSAWPPLEGPGAAATPDALPPWLQARVESALGRLDGHRGGGGGGGGSGGGGRGGGGGGSVGRGGGSSFKDDVAGARQRAQAREEAGELESRLGKLGAADRAACGDGGQWATPGGVIDGCLRGELHGAVRRLALWRFRAQVMPECQRMACRQAAPIRLNHFY
jgi:hypothetical protein